ncbi:MAG: response regulator [Isosphaeraceae bacterium]|nr:response regulator [Isosphaeraceae bacterium]
MLSFAVSTTTATTKVPARPYVLLVDDHRPTLCKLQEVVELEGYATVSTTSATEAIRTCDVRPPQVVITDLAMPNLDGHGLARWVKTRYPSVPLILVTGEVLENGRLAQLQTMFSAVYPKPIDVVSLLERLSRMMPAPPNRPRGVSRP